MLSAMSEQSNETTGETMDTTAPAERSLEQLLADLKAAVDRRDRDQALRLEAAILQRVGSDNAKLADCEREVRALLGQLDDPAPPLAEQAGLSFDAVLSRTRASAAWICSAEQAGLSFDAVLAAAPTTKGRSYCVWFGTNRAPGTKAGSFTGERSGVTSYGHVEVFIPDGHRFGEIGTSFLEKLKRLDLRDDRLRVLNVEQSQGQDDFFAAVRADIAAAHAGGRPADALVFIHGYNNSFEDAAIRTAQIGIDLGLLDGTAGFFSWPSKGSVFAYPSDEATIEASEGALAAFLADFSVRSGADRVHVIAHSMGNRGLLRALQRIAANAAAASPVRFGQIFLAAPDLDRDLFLDLAHLYPRYSQRTTLYASDRDLAVNKSAQLHGAPRAGYYQPVTVAPGIDTVCVPDFDVDLLGHGYFAEAEALLYDIGGLLLADRAPPRQRMKEDTGQGGQSVWRFGQ
jgi:esterase/lipase superfamily enzyme